ncbi:MAG: sigma-54-dependent Fis family transcriptional regulator [Polyangiaceae bacterium]
MTVRRPPETRLVPDAAVTSEQAVLWLAGASRGTMTDHNQTRATDRPIRVSYPKIRVTVTGGPDQGQTREIVSHTLRVGSSSDNDLVLTDATVSRRHCSLSPVADGLRVRDEGSRNGVFVAGARIIDAVFAGRVAIQVGDTVLSVEPSVDRVSVEQAALDRFGDMLGRSACMRELFADLARIAESDVTLLIEGETGTGKELVAESVHRESSRAGEPLVVFDCSAVAPTLAESELFGHERGAFTGATNSRPGVFEQAHGGTIFLDELGELPRDLQPKLLRVLEKREVRRLGSQHTIAVDVRLIAATNRNLAAEVSLGNFREDSLFQAGRRARLRAAAARPHGRPATARRAFLDLGQAAAQPERSVATRVGDVPSPPLAWQRARALERRATPAGHARSPAALADPQRLRTPAACARGRPRARSAAAHRSARSQRRLRASVFGRHFGAHGRQRHARRGHRRSVAPDDAKVDAQARRW